MVIEPLLDVPEKEKFSSLPRLVEVVYTHRANWSAARLAATKSRLFVPSVSGQVFSLLVLKFIRVLVAALTCAIYSVGDDFSASSVDVEASHAVTVVVGTRRGELYLVGCPVGSRNLFAVGPLERPAQPLLLGEGRGLRWCTAVLFTSDYLSGLCRPSGIRCEDVGLWVVWPWLWR